MSDPTYREAQLIGRPAWMSGENSSLLLEVLGLAKDLIVGAVTEGVRLRCAPAGSTDALDAALADRNLQSTGNATADRATLAANWDTWKGSGSRLSLQSALVRAGYPGAIVYDGHDCAGRTPHGWWDYWVALYPPYPPQPWSSYTTANTFGRDTTYGSAAIYQADLLAGEQKRVLDIIRRCAPTNTVLVEVAIPFTGSRFSDAHRFGEPCRYGGRVLVWRL